MDNSLVDRDFIVNVGPQGTFNSSGLFQTSPADIESIFQKFEERAVKKIAIYFHGGLVNESSGLKSARSISAHIRKSDCYPICFVWETGLVETIGTNLEKISETKLFNKLLKLLLKKVIQKLGFGITAARGFGSSPLTDDQINNELSKPVPFARYSRAALTATSRSASNLKSLSSSKALLEAELIGELTPIIEFDPDFQTLIQSSNLASGNLGTRSGSRGVISSMEFIAHVAKIAYRIIVRFIDKTDHDLYPTIIEEMLREFYLAELGAWVWRMMKDKANVMWESNDNRNGSDRYAGRYFLERLAEYKTKYPKVTIDVIGHSAGSIVICNLFKHTATLTTPFSYHHVILMAPACRSDLFETEILSFPSRYKDIRIFTMSDYYECRDVMVPFVYPHSLLYLISGVLEDAGTSPDAFILGMERHINFQHPYDLPELFDLHDYLFTANTNRVSLSVFKGVTLGLETQAKKHGDFHKDPATLRSLVEILKK